MTSKLSFAGRLLLIAIVCIGALANADQPTLAGANYERRAFDIPMRDGVKLHTVIVISKGANNAPSQMADAENG